MLCHNEPTGPPPQPGLKNPLIGFNYVPEAKKDKEPDFVKKNAGMAYLHRKSIDVSIQAQPPVWVDNYSGLRNSGVPNSMNMNMSFNNETSDLNVPIQPPDCFSPAGNSQEPMSCMSETPGTPYGTSPMTMDTISSLQVHAGSSAHSCTPPVPVMMAHSSQPFKFPSQLTPTPRTETNFGYQSQRTPTPRAASENPGVGNNPSQFNHPGVPTRVNSHPITSNQCNVNRGANINQQFIPAQAFLTPPGLEPRRAVSVHTVMAPPNQGPPTFISTPSLEAPRAVSVPFGTSYCLVPTNVGPTQIYMDARTGQMVYGQPVAYVQTNVQYPMGQHGTHYMTATHGIGQVAGTQGMGQVTATQEMGQVAATQGVGQVAATHGISYLATSAPQNPAPQNPAPQNQTHMHGTPPVSLGQPVMYAQPSNSAGLLPPLSRAQSAPNVGVDQSGVRSYSAPPRQVDAIMRARASSSPWRKKIVQQKKDSCPFGRKKKPVVPSCHTNLPRRSRALNIKTKKSKMKQQKKQKTKGSPKPGAKPAPIKPAAERPSLSSDDPEVTISKEIDQQQRDYYAHMRFREPEDFEAEEKWIFEDEKEKNMVTLWLKYLGKFAIIGTIKDVIKPMGGMIRARDAKVAVPLDETSKEWKLLQKHKELLDDKKRTPASDAMAKEKGYNKETGPRVPNVGYSKIEFFGAGCARRAMRVFDVVNACTIGDLADIQATWVSQKSEKEKAAEKSNEEAADEPKEEEAADEPKAEEAPEAAKKANAVKSRHYAVMAGSVDVGDVAVDAASDQIPSN